MTKPLLLDTHIWLWLINGERLSRPMRDAVIAAAQEGRLMASAISVWEIALKMHQGKLAFDQPLREWLEFSQAHSGPRVIDVNADIAMESYELPGAFHGDPADRMIAATARCEGAVLVTQDKAMLRYAKQGHLQVL